MAKKTVAAMPKSSKKTTAVKGDATDAWKDQHGHLFKSTPKNFSMGNDIKHKKDLTRVVKWPVYIRVQRQRAILQKRLKVPPAINQFTKTLEKNAATNVLKLLSNYRPEDVITKKARRLAAAEAETKGKGGVSAAPDCLKYGLNQITSLIEGQKAKLVVIAHDVHPIELVVWLPALCRKMGTPYVIVKGKSRLGQLVHQKTVTAVALTSVDKADAAALQQVVDHATMYYQDGYKNWGNQEMSLKAQHKALKIAKGKSLLLASKKN